MTGHVRGVERPLETFNARRIVTISIPETRELPGRSAQQADVRFEPRNFARHPRNPPFKFSKQPLRRHAPGPLASTSSTKPATASIGMWSPATSEWQRCSNAAVKCA